MQISPPVTPPIPPSKTSDTTQYPVIFMHGMGGRAHNFSNSVGRPIEKSPHMGKGQKIHRLDIARLHSSETRGEQAYQEILNYMTATGVQKVSLVGHSQGGLDMRKAAHRLKYTKINGSPAGEPKVAVLLSLQSPHRGSPVAEKVDRLIPKWADRYVNVVYRLASKIIPAFGIDISRTPGRRDSLMAAVRQLTSENMQRFNASWPSEGVAHYVGSLMSYQETYSSSSRTGRNFFCFASDALFGGRTMPGYDDCLVNAASAQMGHRLTYSSNLLSGDMVTQTNVSYVGNLNRPGAGGRNRLDGLFDADHFDVVYEPIVGGDGAFNRDKFYASVVRYIQDNEPQ